MIRNKAHKALFVLSSMLGLSSGDPFIPHIPEEQVSTSLYGSVTLPCMFFFVQSLEGLTVIWDKDVQNMKPILYWILKGVEHLEEQDPRYRGRVELFTEFSHGNLELILRNITYEDEGTYYCRAANNKGHGYKKLTLSIDGLDADNPTVTRVTIDGKRRWKCMGSSDYHNPQIQWITTAGEDLSSYGTISVIEESNGRKLVESVLNYDVKANVRLSCHITEGRSAEDITQANTRAAEDNVIFSSDDNEEKKKSPDPEIIICAVIGTFSIIIGIIVLIRIYRHHKPPPSPAFIICDLLKKKESKIRKDDKAAMGDKTHNSSDKRHVSLLQTPA